MPLTPDDVQNKRFTVVRFGKSGYDEEEVDTFLDEIEAEMRRLIAECTALRAAPPPQPVAAPDPPPAPVAAEDPNETALRTLLLAQRTADDAIAQARAEADQVLSEARMRAATVDQEVQAEHAAKEAELAAQRTGIEAEITQLRDFERDYRTRLRAYLEGQLNDLERLAAASSGPGSGVRVSGISSQRPGGSALPDSLPPLATPPSFSGPFSSAASPVSPPEPAETASAPPDPEPVTPPAPSEDSPAPITGPRHASLSAFDTDVDAGSDAPSAPPVEPDDDTDESSD